MEITTPFGLLPIVGVSALRAFGRQAERLEYPCIDVGGFIVPGRDPVITNLPGTEHEHHATVERAGPDGWEQSAPEQAGSAAGPRQRSPEAAPGASPHAVRHGLSTRNLDLSALVAYHPLARVVASTETVVHLNIPVGLFHELPIGARLTLEVPLMARERLSHPGRLSGVPDVRAWAVWEGGPMHGKFIVGHHQNPDRGICACMPQDWVLGVHALHDLVAFCVLWVAKVLHERVLGFYPGPQHCSVTVRVERDRPEEYCGCGSRRRYRECCRATDLARSPYDRWREWHAGRAEYLAHLKRQARSSVPPQALLHLGIHSPVEPKP